jgi:hypothetical protein
VNPQTEEQSSTSYDVHNDVLPIPISPSAVVKLASVKLALPRTEPRRSPGGPAQVSRSFRWENLGSMQRQ